MKRRVFEIDEILDVIGDYSSYGKVTVMLDHHEADSLWCRLNGRGGDGFIADASFRDVTERYLSLFNTMSIDSLVVLHDSCNARFSREGHFDLDDRPRVGIREGARRRFSAGYQMGLLLQLQAVECMALGRAGLGGYVDPLEGMGSALVLEYMENWAAVAHGSYPDRAR